MPDTQKQNPPVLKPLKENNALFVFEHLERSSPSNRELLNAVITEASNNKVFNNGQLKSQSKSE